MEVQGKAEESNGWRCRERLRCVMDWAVFTTLQFLAFLDKETAMQPHAMVHL